MGELLFSFSLPMMSQVCQSTCMLFWEEAEIGFEFYQGFELAFGGSVFRCLEITSLFAAAPAL